MLDLGALKLSIKVDSQEANEELGKAKKSIGEVAGDLKISWYPQRKQQ